MSINTDVTLKRLIAEFSTWADDHKMVNDFGYGQYLEVFRASGRNYAALIINAPSATSDTWYINYNIEIICLDYVTDDEANKDRVNSDTISIIRDLENTMRYANRWQSFCRIDSSFNYQKVDEFGADKCFGWIATLTLKIKKKHGICDIQALLPLYDFETGTIVNPSCAAATYENSDGTFTQSIASGATYVSGDVTITINGTPNVRPSNKDLSFTVSGSPVGNSMNGDALTDAVSGTTKTFVVQYANGDPVTVTLISDSATAFVGSVPNAAAQLNTANQVKTGDTTDGDRGRSRTVLSGNNPFGNTNAQTDTTGAQTYANDIVIDWNQADMVGETVLGVYRITQDTMNYTDQVTNAASLTIDGFSGWGIINMNELCTLLERSSSNPNNYLNYSPYNIVTAAQGDRVFTSTKADIATRQIMLTEAGALQNLNKSTVAKAIVVREFTFAELGL